MSLMALRTTLSIWSLVTDFGPRVSPAITTFVGGGERFARGTDRPRIDTGLRALAEKQINDLVGNPVANLVRMAFGNRF